MIVRPAKACFASFIVLLLLAACQTNTPLPTATTAATISVGSPIPVEAVTPADPLTPTPETAATQTSVDLSSLKGHTVEFWHPWQGDVTKRAADLVDAFNRTNEWGIVVRVKPYYSAGALYEAVSSGLKDAGAGLPGVVAASSDQLVDWSAAGSQVVDLTRLVNDPQLGLKEEDQQDFYPAIWDQDQARGRRLGIPAIRSAQVIFYNQTWARELGFTSPPATPEEFQVQACAAAKENNGVRSKEINGTGGWLINTDALATLSWLAAFGAQPVPQADAQPYTFDTKEAQSSVAFLRGMYDKSCAWLGRKAEPYEYFARRMALFYSGTLQDMHVQAQWQTQLKTNDQWVVLPYPGVDGKRVVYSSGYSYAILQPKNTADDRSRLASWLFIRWMEQPENLARLGEALPSLPVRGKMAEQMSADRSTFAWDQIQPLTDYVRPAPALSSWREARRLVEDASWQIFHLPVEDIAELLPQTLQQLDQAIQDTLKSSQ